MDSLERLVCEITGARRATRGDHIQSLWSGYGELLKMQLEGVEPANVVVKHAQPPTLRHAVKGTEVERSHARKLRSYAVESVWYREFAARCDAQCRGPQPLGIRAQSGSWLFVLEDLDAAGFPRRATCPSAEQIRAVLRWLAAFHATHLGVKPENLWAIGTYWHLGTRPDELLRMRDRRLRDVATKLDARLNSCQFRTLVHGDAKSDNFCFSASPASLAVVAVDYQYVGGGCGMKDVAYFFSSAWDSAECAAFAAEALDYYFVQLRIELGKRRPDIDASQLEAEWRALYPFAWADFQRFLSGWAPGQYDDHAYAQRMAVVACSSL